MKNQLYLPLAVASGVTLYFVFFQSSSRSVELAVFGAIVIVLNAYIFPLLAGLYVSKPNVDIAYYFLGFIGVLLFFEAERLERKVSDLRQQSYTAGRDEIRLRDQAELSQSLAQVSLDAALEELQSLEEMSSADDRLLLQLRDDQSDIAKRMMSQAQSNIDELYEQVSDFERPILSEIGRKEALSEVIELAGFQDLRGNLVRRILDPTDQIAPFRVRECLLNGMDNCELPPEEFEDSRLLVNGLQRRVAEHKDRAHPIYVEIADAEATRVQADNALDNALKERDESYNALEESDESSSTASDYVFVYADNFRRSFWPYAIIIAFSLKLASANSARSNEARTNKAKALKLQMNAALTVEPDSTEGLRIVRKSVKLARKQLFRRETLGDARHASSILLKIIEKAEKDGQIDPAKTGLLACRRFARKFKAYEQTRTGLVDKAMLLRRTGDLYVCFKMDRDARKCYSESYDSLQSGQERSMLDEGMLELATAMVRMAVIETRLKRHSAAQDWLAKIEPLRMEMPEQFESEIDRMLLIAGTTYGGAFIQPRSE
jgi:hypothetical protein